MTPPTVQLTAAIRTAIGTLADAVDQYRDDIYTTTLRALLDHRPTYRTPDHDRCSCGHSADVTRGQSHTTHLAARIAAALTGTDTTP